MNVQNPDDNTHLQLDERPEIHGTKFPIPVYSKHHPGQKVMLTAL
jgi:hypothetical protein